MRDVNVARWSIAGLLAIAVIGSACVEDGAGPQDSPQPANLAIQDGDGQSATVGTQVEVSPAVLVTTASGAPVPGVTVTFAVTSGGGNLTGASPTTDEEGVAKAGGWTVGTVVGMNVVRATVSDLPAVEFAAQAVAGLPATMVADTPVGMQTGLVGTEVAARPRVRVADAFGNPVSDVSVTFGIGTGEGEINMPAQTTDSGGIASVGSWTLGHSGLNTLVASLDQIGTIIDAVTFEAYAFPTFTQVAVEGVEQPPFTTGLAYNREREMLTAVSPGYGIGEIPPTGGSWSKLTDSTPGSGQVWAVVHEGAQRLLIMSSSDRPFYWDYVNPGWTAADSGDVPAPRDYPALVYDSVNGRVVLYGGVVTGGSSDPVADVYAWDGGVWERLPDAPAGPRGYHRMVYDREHERILVHGGTSAGGHTGGQAVTDTWVIDKQGQWTQLDTQLPRNLAAFGMAYDGQRGTLVIVGGTTLSDGGSYGLSTDVWELVDGQWLLTPAKTPVGPRVVPTAIYVRSVGGVLMFGSQHAGWNDVWLYGEVP